MRQDAESYTARVEREAAEIVKALESLRDLMREHGDDIRSMDLDEALAYVEGATG